MFDPFSPDPAHLAFAQALAEASGYRVPPDLLPAFQYAQIDPSGDLWKPATWELLPDGRRRPTSWEPVADFVEWWLYADESPGWLPPGYGRDVAEAWKAELAVREEQREEVPVACEEALTLEPGGFAYRGGRVHDLTGRPFDMLRALLESRHGRLTADQLRVALGLDDQTIEYPAQVIKDVATDLRRALRGALKEAGARHTKNPLPSIGRGDSLTYCLEML
jgi:hypothetical protein